MNRSRPDGDFSSIGLSPGKARVVTAALRGALKIYDVGSGTDFHGSIDGVELSGYRCHRDRQLLEFGGITASYGDSSYCFEHRRNGVVAIGERGLGGETPSRWFCIANGELKETMR